MRKRNAQAFGRFVIAALTRKSGLALVALSLLLLLGAGTLLDSGSSASASDSETAALIGYFNQYRSSQHDGLLSTSASANSDAQAGANDSANACGYLYLSYVHGHSVIWGTYGYETATAVWQAYASDSSVLGYIGNPNYHSVGIGRAKNSGCNLGYIWVIILDTSGGTVTTSTPTLTATPTPHTLTPTPHTPIPTPTTTHTATATVTAFPTATPTSTVSAVPTESSTPTPTDIPLCDVIPSATRPDGCVGTPTPTHRPTPTPSPTPLPEIAGDVNCSGSIDLNDVLTLLETAANAGTTWPCLHASGIDCTGGVDASDALFLLEYIEGMDFSWPPGCPPLGSTATPTPTPSPTPVGTSTPTPTVSPIPAAINDCELAIVSYHLANSLWLRAETHCTPGLGAEYDCTFSDDGKSAACLASTSDFPNYTCSFLEASFGGCVPDSGQPEYQCFNDGQSPVDCLPTQAGYAEYQCAVNGVNVICTSDPPFPDFTCTYEGADFTCTAQGEPTATPPG